MAKLMDEMGAMTAAPVQFIGRIWLHERSDSAAKNIGSERIQIDYLARTMRFNTAESVCNRFLRTQAL